jgi:hypothetical protein
MPVDAPLSNGQLWSWREVERYPKDWMRDANLPTAWDLRGLPLDRVTTALRRLVDRHECLRTTYHVRDGQPVQRVHQTVTPPVEYVDRVITGRDDPERTKEELATIPFPMTDALPWRGVLVTTDGAPVFLALSFSHLIVDVWSIHHLQDQFRALVADPDADAHMGPTLRELARRQRDESWRGQQESSERYWRQVLADGLMDELPTLPAGAERNRIEATLHSFRLGGLAAEAARRHGVTPPAVLMSFIAAGLARHTDTDRVTMSLMASNRFAAEHQHVIGTMNQLIPVSAIVDPGATLAEHVKRWHWASARTYRYSCYDFDRVAALAADRPRPAERRRSDARRAGLDALGPAVRSGVPGAGGGSGRSHQRHAAGGSGDPAARGRDRHPAGDGARRAARGDRSEDVPEGPVERQERGAAAVAVPRRGAGAAALVVRGPA